MNIITATPTPFPFRKQILPTFHNTLGSATDLANSVIGGACTAVGTVSYEAVQHDHGVKCSYSNNFVKTPFVLSGGFGATTVSGTTTYLDAITIEMFVKYTDYSVTNGVVSDATRHVVFTAGYEGANEWILMLQHAPTIGTIIVCYDYNGTLGISEYIPAAINISLNDIVHYGYVYDTNGIDGSSDTLRLYMDNVEIYSSTTAARPRIIFSGTNYDGSIYIGTQNAFRPRESDAVHDTIKVYNYAKTDFSDRFVE